MNVEEHEQAVDAQWRISDALILGARYDAEHSDDRYEQSETDRESERVEAARLTP